MTTTQPIFFLKISIPNQSNFVGRTSFRGALSALSDGDQMDIHLGLFRVEIYSIFIGRQNN
jgi:hypothetical protein